MTDHRAPQGGAADLSAPRAPLADGQQAQQSGPAAAPPRRAPRAPKLRAPGFAAAFGTGGGAAVVFRDLASI